MKKIIFFCLKIIIVGQVFSQDSRSVAISEWINEPTQEELNKPLIFVDFWATWCGPCIHSMSHTQNLEEEFKEDILFIYVSNEPSHKVIDFMEQKNKTFYSAIDHLGENLKTYEIVSLPQSVLINGSGKVVWKGNPTNLKRADLLKQINKAKKDTVSVNRIKRTYVERKTIQWQHYTANGSHLRYANVDNTDNNFILDGNDFTLSGTVPYIMSRVKEQQLSQVLDKTDHIDSYIFTSTLITDSSFKEVVEDFLVHKYKIEEHTEEEEVIVLTEKSTNLLLTKDIYNFENGDNAYLADEASLLIDNASIEEMVKLFSQFTDLTFEYAGENKNQYDWNLLLLNESYSIETFANELDFNVKKEKHPLTYYYISNQN